MVELSTQYVDPDAVRLEVLGLERYRNPFLIVYISVLAVVTSAKRRENWEGRRDRRWQEITQLKRECELLGKFNRMEEQYGVRAAT